MIAEYEINGKQLRSQVISENTKTVIVWGPGKVCTTCSGHGYGIAMASHTQFDTPKPIKTLCTNCKGRPVGKNSPLKLHKKKVKLRPCAMATWGYSYLSAPNY